MKRNPDIESLRRAHRVHLSRYGSVTLRARPITSEQVCNHAEKFWFGADSLEENRKQPDSRDILLHAILCLGLNVGLRFDEVSKLSMEHLTIDSGQITFTIVQSIKNSTEQRNYEVRDLPGNSSLRSSVYMDPFVAVISWLTERGSSSGAVFCDIKETNNGIIINPQIPWSSSKFTAFFRSRLQEIGASSGDLQIYSGNSIKRGCVQLYRSLNVKDEQIMEIIQMKVQNAYSNYTAAYNGYAPSDLPRFSFIGDYLANAEQLKK